MSDWLNRPRNKAMDPRAVYLIAKRRRQMLVHCYIYYRLDDNVITDELWMQWAQQLKRVQDKYGKQIRFYDREFADWDGSTGYHLGHGPISIDPNVVRVAYRTLELHRQGVDLLWTKQQQAATDKIIQHSKEKYGW